MTFRQLKIYYFHPKKSTSMQIREKQPEIDASIGCMPMNLCASLDPPGHREVTLDDIINEARGSGDETYS
jgi:hypothetical protein